MAAVWHGPQPEAAGGRHHAHRPALHGAAQPQLPHWSRAGHRQPLRGPGHALFREQQRARPAGRVAKQLPAIQLAGDRGGQLHPRHARRARPRRSAGLAGHGSSWRDNPLSLVVQKGQRDLFSSAAAGSPSTTTPSTIRWTTPTTTSTRRAPSDPAGVRRLRPLAVQPPELRADPGAGHPHQRRRLATSTAGPGTAAAWRWST